MSVDEKKWRIEADARTLLEAQAVRADEPRYGAALKELKVIVAEAEKEALSKRVAMKLEKAIKE